LLFLGKGDGTFVDITKDAGPEITDETQGRGAAFADFDGDGRLDVAVTNKNSPVQVLLNRLPAAGSWTILDLRAPPPNVFAVGARVRIEAGGRAFVRELYAGSSYLSGDDLSVHAGLGSAATIDRVTVRWPGGDVEMFPSLPVNQRLTLRKGEGRRQEVPGMIR
jgi:hypothetical protein